MFFKEWFILIVVSLWFSVLAFIWALQSGQFREQKRARFLPLSEETAPSDVPFTPVSWKKERFALTAVAVAGTAGMIGIIISCLSSR